MSHNSRILTSLDIGTTAIKVIVGEIINDQVNIIAVSTQASDGIRKGVIVDIDQTVSSIKEVISQAERKANVQIEEVIVGLAAYGLSFQKTRGVVKTENPDAEITNQDIQNVVSQAMIQAVAADKELMSLNIQQFIVDGFDDIADPRGMVGLRLEVEAEVYSAPKTILHSLKKCVSMAGLHITDIVSQVDALAAAALSREQKNHATILIDMGGGQTTASLYQHNQIKHCYVDPEGGNYVSRDLAVVLNTTLEEAERLKINYGYAHPADANPDSQVVVNVLSQKGVEKVDETYIVEIIHARLMQILNTIYHELDQERVLESSNEIVVSGGNASIPGIKRVLENVFQKDIVLYLPEQMGIRYPTFSTALGLIQYVKDLDDVQLWVNSYINQLHDESEANSHIASKKEAQERVDQAPLLDQQEVAESLEEVRHEDDENVSYNKTVIKEKNEDSFFDKIKKMISSFFD